MTQLGIKYINKNRTKPLLPAVPVVPTTTDSLRVTDLKTNIPGRSAVVKKAGASAQHIYLNNVRDWSVEGSTLIIATVDSAEPIILIFSSHDEAEAAEIRFTAIKNGGVITQ